jgi:hypothetical protein
LARSKKVDELEMSSEAMTNSPKKGINWNCPKVDELIAKSGARNTTVSTNVINLETSQSFYDLELTFPFPRCENAKD